MIYIGTSGFKYPEWKGTFYPANLSPAKMLSYYAEHLNTVEINFTFYRMPTPMLLQSWAQEAAQPNFKFSFKAPRRITHDALLKNSEAVAGVFIDTIKTLGPQAGAILFQLPPSFAKDLAVLEDFLQVLPTGVHAAFEFRHTSWHDDAVFDLLHSHNIALCIADSEKISTPIVQTAHMGYFRLRDEGYKERDIERWSKEVAKFAESANDVFVYFKHEEKGLGPKFAQELGELVSSQLSAR